VSCPTRSVDHHVSWSFKTRSRERDACSGWIVRHLWCPVLALMRSARCVDMHQPSPCRGRVQRWPLPISAMSVGQSSVGGIAGGGLSSGSVRRLAVAGWHGHGWVCCAVAPLGSLRLVGLLAWRHLMPGSGAQARGRGCACARRITGVVATAWAPGARAHADSWGQSDARGAFVGLVSCHPGVTPLR
jgi:hypothetical protein